MSKMLGEVPITKLAKAKMPRAIRLIRYLPKLSKIAPINSWLTPQLIIKTISDNWIALLGTWK